MVASNPIRTSFNRSSSAPRALFNLKLYYFKCVDTDSVWEGHEIVYYWKLSSDRIVDISSEASSYLLSTVYLVHTRTYTCTSHKYIDEFNDRADY